MLLLILLALLAIVLFGVGFAIKWLFILAVIVALVFVISFFMGAAGGGALPARVVAMDRVGVDAARLGELQRQKLEPDDVDDRMLRRHDRRLAAELLQRRDRAGGPLGHAALSLEHERADRLVDRGEMPVQQLLRVMCLGS